MNRTLTLRRRRPSITFVVAIWFAAFGIADSRAADDVATQLHQLRTGYATQLRDLSVWCDAHDLKRQAEFTRNWLPRREPTMDYIFVLPDSAAAPEKLVATAAARQWWDRFTELRQAEAKDLFELATAAAKGKQPALAFELVRETVRENPNHEAARAILGQQLHDGRWVSAEAARRLQAGQVWTDKFGWLPAEQVSQYERGGRFYHGHWIDAAEDDRLHSNIYNGWHVESDHYTVITNHSLAEGARLATQLELLNEVWRQLFLGYYAAPGQVEHWFAEPATAAAGTSHKTHQVVYFRDQSQYVTALEAAEPQIAKTLGYYSNNAKTAYFFAGDQQYAGTLFHEATHQLFREVRSGAKDPGRKNNFWIVEAVACFMESLAEHRLLDDEPYGAYWTVGGENEGRVPAARKRLLDDQFYVPLRELSAAGMRDLQHDGRLPMIYSQISGQVLFLMHADNGRYRQPLMNYLVAVYTEHSDPATLEKLTGAKFEELDRQYREFMK
jgi:hypothetical protein